MAKKKNNVVNKELTLSTAIKEIQDIADKVNVEIPWHVWTSFAKLDAGQRVELHGNNISFGGHSDFKTLEEQRKAAEWIANILGGQIKWEQEV
jgi:hypothetical protein